MSFSLFTVNNNALEMSPAKIKDYLSAELGVSEAQAKNTKILAIMDNPSTEIGKYDTAMDNLIKKGAVHYKTDYDKLVSLGISDERAQRFAKQKAAAFINSEKEILDFEYPLMSDINVLASATAKTSINITKSTQRGIGKKKKKGQN